ncbi:hypothetical protein [Planctomycetes bacterium SV_7m_r]
MPSHAPSLSVETNSENYDDVVKPIPMALLVLMSTAAVMVLVGLIVPRLTLFLVPAFTVCGFWVTAKGLKIAFSGGASRTMSPLGVYGFQVAIAGASGLLLTFVGMLAIGDSSRSQGDFMARFLLFLFSIVFFPIAVYLRNRAIKHLGGN